jgi:hypothetical protein
MCQQRCAKKCNVEITLTRNAWLSHIKSKTHLENDPDNCRKLCEKCNIEMATKIGPNI